MTEGRAARPTLPPLATTTRMFARSLGCSPDQLTAAFRPAIRDDLPALLAFRQRTGWDDDAYLRWRYGLDTDGRDGPGTLWLLRDDTGVLAVIGSEAQRIHHAGRTLDGQLLMDIQLRPDLEGGGGGVWLNQMMMAKADVTLAVGANAHSIGLVKRMFSPLPQRSYRVLPLDSAEMLRQHGLGTFAVRVGAPVLDAGWSLVHRAAQRRSRSGIDVVEVAQVPTADIEALRAALPPQVACVMPSPEHLQWRLFDNPRARYDLMVARRAGVCVGYMAVRNVAADGTGKAGLHLLDWKTAVAGADDALMALLQAAVARARKERCSRVFTTVLDEQAAPLLKRLGFLGRESPSLVAGVHSAVPLPGNGGHGRWQITDLSFDSDGIY